MKELHVLSIDFDFFQNTTEYIIRNCYPDGIDLPTAITKLTWSSHYANPKSAKLLSEVTTNKKQLEELKDIIDSNCLENTPLMCTNSHKHIYDFIKTFMETSEDKIEHVYVTNLDMHHDAFNKDDEVDCGNWAYHVKKDFPDCHIKWIANAISEDMYGIEENIFDSIETNLKSLQDETFDMIFVCRSDTWLPPHLDNDFDDLLYYLVASFPNNQVEMAIEQPRYDKSFEEQIAHQKDMFVKMKEKINKKYGTRKE